MPNDNEIDSSSRIEGSGSMFKHRLFHYAILLATSVLLTLPNLGAHCLWDMDEGVNAEAAREMLEAGTWITPLFNFELRTAKPVFLYWLQMFSYLTFGVSEFSARLPSALAAIATVLLVYELTRSMFGYRTGLLAGIVLASALEFCMLAHAATTDSTLLFFTVLTFYSFWIGSRNGGRAWFVPTGMAAGLAVMTKGPVGIVMPTAVIFFYLLWNRELKRLLDRRLLWGFLAFFLVAAPWYIIVTAETRGAWIKNFIARDNVRRFMQPMENHEGPIFYHFIGITILFAPWSMFLWPTCWYGIKEARQKKADESAEAKDAREACRLLACWLIIYFIFFSIAATKLPNYVLAIYPALAILTARFLESWQSGKVSIPGWIMPTSIAALFCIGLVTIAGFAFVGGAFHVPISKVFVIPGLANWSWLGVIPLAGAVVGGIYWRRERRNRFVASIAICSVAFVALLAAYPVSSMDNVTAPRQLVEQANVRQPQRDVRLLALVWFQPSLVFYSRREVERIDSWQQASDALATQQPVFLFVPELLWAKIQSDFPEGRAYRTVAQHYDFLKNYNVVVVTNQ